MKKTHIIAMALELCCARVCELANFLINRSIILCWLCLTDSSERILWSRIKIFWIHFFNTDYSMASCRNDVIPTGKVTCNIVRTYICRLHPRLIWKWMRIGLNRWACNQKPAIKAHSWDWFMSTVTRTTSVANYTV